MNDPEQPDWFNEFVNNYGFNGPLLFPGQLGHASAGMSMIIRLDTESGTIQCDAKPMKPCE